MSYVRKVVSHQERLLCIFQPHWIYVAEGVFWFFVLTAAGLIVDHFFYSYVGEHRFFHGHIGGLHFRGRFSEISLIFMTIGIGVFWTYLMVYVSSEIGLTDQRIIHKKGLVFIEVDQVDLEDIRAEQVFHGWFGWLLGYGRIRMNCRFIEDVWLPAIYNPYRLVKASHNARLKHPLIEYGVDEFHANMERIDQTRQEQKNKQALFRLRRVIKARFGKAAAARSSDQ